MKECTLHLIKYHKSDREEVSTASEVSSFVAVAVRLASFAALIQVTRAYRLITVWQRWYYCYTACFVFISLEYSIEDLGLLNGQNNPVSAAAEESKSYLTTKESFLP